MEQAQTSEPSMPITGAPPPGVYDEYLSQGLPRPHQRDLADFIARIPPGELYQLRAAVHRHISEQEVTFNILGAPDGENRPWQLDPLPLVMDHVTWGALATGLRQRARLMTALYADLYGAQRTLKEGAIPRAAVLGNPAYERACFGWEPLGGHKVHLMAVDLGRNLDGSFCVYSDRTAAPAGAGYAMENRIALAGALSELFSSYRVERLRPFFDALRQTLAELSPEDAEPDARTVVLSSGLGDESSFEHAYLTRYLGYELVEGRDLTVRDRTVFLKTLSGLKRVDAIVRRVNDAWCDPLELRGDSLLGVPGLVSAAQGGNVALVNPIGTGLTESPALRPYLDAAARVLLGEPLLLPSAQSWWCGDANSLAYVLAHLDELTIKPGFADRRGSVLTPALMSQADKAQLVERLQAHPGQFIAEGPPQLAVAPVLNESSLSYQRVSMRTFLCRHGDEYLVMPGGLARMNAGPDGLFLSLEEEGLSKDIWVTSPTLTEGAAPPKMPDGRVNLRRGGVDVPSRLLDDLYWLGRSIERCDVTARLLRAGLDRLSSEAGEEAPVGLVRIAKALQQFEVIPNALVLQDLHLSAVLRRAITLPGVPSNLRGQVQGIHHLALRGRSRLSRDAWHNLHRLAAIIEGAPQNPPLSDAVLLLDELLVMLSAVRGTTIDNMVRSQAWTFLDMGRRVERGVQTLSLMQVMLAPKASRAHMDVLLEIADSSLTYRSRYLSSLQVAPVVDLLLTDDTNPRSVAFQASELRNHVDRLPRPSGTVRSRAERRIIALQSNLLTADVTEICAGDGVVLRELLEDATNLLWQFSDDVNRAWLSHTAHSRAVSPPLWLNDDLEVGP